MPKILINMAGKKKKKSKTGNKSLFKRILLITGKILLAIFLLSILLPLSYRWINPPVTPLMVIRKISDKAPVEKKWMDIDQISPHMISCAIAAEDNNFLGHRGFDWGAIQKAINERESGKRKRGASTISQQTAKNVFLWPKQSWVRKGLETYFTFLIELFWNKERIMEVYLNVIEMGNGIYGAEAAARHYFKKPAKDLTLKQSALITAAYPDPRHRNPANPSAYLRNQSDRITALTRKIGKIGFDPVSIKKARERYKAREAERRKKNDGKLLNI